MYSNLVPFENVVEAVRDETGITILRNKYPHIRRLMYRVERDIGFGGTAVLKRVKYSVAGGSIIFDGSIYKALLPEDLLKLEAIGMCAEGVCPGDYRISGNWLFFCKDKKIEEFNLIYYTLLCDGEGNPVTTENHMEAITSGITYWLYKQKMFNNKGHFQMLRYYEQYYHDRIGDSRAQDIMPNSMEEWAKAANIMKMSSRDAILYLKDTRCFCSVPEAINMNDNDNTDPDNGGGGSSSNENVSAIYSFQFNSLTKSILDEAEITQAYLDANGTLHAEADLLEGKFINYMNTGRIGFAIKTTAPDQYNFTDVLGNILNDTVFDKVYDSEREMDIYISKQYYTESSVFYKFKSV
jgi:hypothetical protein